MQPNKVYPVNGWLSITCILTDLTSQVFWLLHCLLYHISFWSNKQVVALHWQISSCEGNQLSKFFKIMPFDTWPWWDCRCNFSPSPHNFFYSKDHKYVIYSMFSNIKNITWICTKPQQWYPKSCELIVRSEYITLGKARNPSLLHRERRSTCILQIQGAFFPQIYWLSSATKARVGGNETQ